MNQPMSIDMAWNLLVKASREMVAKADQHEACFQAVQVLRPIIEKAFNESQKPMEPNQKNSAI